LFSGGRKEGIDTLGVPQVYGVEVIKVPW